MTANILVVSLDGERVRFVHPPLGPEESIREVTVTDGKAVLGTTRAAYVFDPADFAPIGWTPSIRVVHAMAGSLTVAEQVATGERIVLPTAASSFTFQIAFPYFDRAGHFSIAHRMQEFAPEWSAVEDPGNPLAFSNGSLRTGEFLLEIEARSADGRRVRFETPVVIPTPWWRSRMVRGGAITVLSLVLVVAMLRRARRKEDRVREVQHLLAVSREREQREVARWLHDDPLQEVHGSLLMLKSIRAEEFEEELEFARQALGRAVVNIRKRLAVLRPSDVESPVLATGIPACVAQVGMERMVTIDAEDPGDLPPGVASALLSVCRNALMNIARHAEADSVRVRIRRMWWGVRLEIDDDGKGFEAPDDVLALAREGHFGLLGMQEWMRNVGGELRVRSVVGRGTTLTADAYLGPAGVVGKVYERLRNGIIKRRTA